MPRAGLNPELVVSTAAEVADEAGLERLTLAAIADRFGVAVPSLYKHVDGIEDVQRQLTVRAVRELGAALAAAAGGTTGREALPGLANAYRSYAHRHPGRYAASLRAPAPEHTEHRAASQEVLATVLDVLAGYGLAGADAIHATRAVRSALHGFVALEAAGGFGLPHDIDQSYQQLVAALDQLLVGWHRTAAAPPAG